MPYLLAANPGSPHSWVKMETESVRSGNSDFGLNHPQSQRPPTTNGVLATPTQGRGRTHLFAHAQTRAAAHANQLTHHASGSATLGHSAGAKYANYANANSVLQQQQIQQQQSMAHHPTVPNFVSLVHGSSQQQLNNSSSTNNSGRQQHNSSSTPPMMSPTSVLSNYSLSAVNGLVRHNYGGNGSPLMGNTNNG